jgi:cytochrome c553
MQQTNRISRAWILQLLLGVAAGTDAFPRLAGQHREYLIKQLGSFQSNMRNVAVMHGVALGLQRADIQAVAAYLQSLGQLP